jgi:hypothetical protein
MRDYRRRLILQFPELRFLDEAPVDDDERRCVMAWSSGGIEAERAERARIKAEKDAKHDENMRKLRELQGKKPAPPVGEAEAAGPAEAPEADDEPFFVTEQTGDGEAEID